MNQNMVDILYKEVEIVVFIINSKAVISMEKQKENDFRRST